MARLQQGSGKVLIEDVQDPVSDSDAATKGYVDSSSFSDVYENADQLPYRGLNTGGSVLSEPNFTILVTAVSTLEEREAIVVRAGTEGYQLQVRIADVSDALAVGATKVLRVSNGSDEGYYAINSVRADGDNYDIFVQFLNGNDRLNDLVSEDLDSNANEQFFLAHNSLHLQALTNVFADSVTDGQALVWDDDNDRWIPGDTSSSLTAGNGIDISSNVVSADLGDGLQFDDDNAIEVDTDTIASRTYVDIQSGLHDDYTNLRDGNPETGGFTLHTGVPTPGQFQFQILGNAASSHRQLVFATADIDSAGATVKLIRAVDSDSNQATYSQYKHATEGTDTYIYIYANPKEDNATDVLDEAEDGDVITFLYDTGQSAETVPIFMNGLQVNNVNGLPTVQARLGDGLGFADDGAIEVESIFNPPNYDDALMIDLNADGNNFNVGPSLAEDVAVVAREVGATDQFSITFRNQDIDKNVYGTSRILIVTNNDADGDPTGFYTVTSVSAGTQGGVDVITLNVIRPVLSGTDTLNSLVTTELSESVSATILVTGTTVQNIDNLGGVNTDGATNGQVLTWNNSNSEWEPADVSSELDDLSDVDTDGALDGYVLTYDADETEWVASPVSDGNNGFENVDRSEYVGLVSDDNDQDIELAFTFLADNTQSLGQRDAIASRAGSAYELSIRQQDINVDIPIGARRVFRIGQTSNSNHGFYLIQSIHSDAGNYDISLSHISGNDILDDLVSVDLDSDTDERIFVNESALRLNLDGLEDVSNTAPTDGQVLTWNNSNSEWEPTDSINGIDINTSGSFTDPDAEGTSSIAIGNNAQAYDEDNIAIGTNSEAGDDSSDAENAIAIGHDSTASAISSMALGRSSSATHSHSTALGFGAVTSQDYEVALGDENGPVTVAAGSAGSEHFPNQVASKAYVDARIHESQQIIVDSDKVNTLQETTSNDETDTLQDPNETDAYQVNQVSTIRTGIARARANDSGHDAKHYLGVYTNVGGDNPYTGIQAFDNTGSLNTNIWTALTSFDSEGQIVDTPSGETHPTRHNTTCLAWQFEGEDYSTIQMSAFSLRMTVGWYNRRRDGQVDFPDPPRFNTRIEVAKLPAGATDIDDSSAVVLSTSDNNSHHEDDIDLGTNFGSSVTRTYNYDVPAFSSVQINSDEIIVVRMYVTFTAWDNSNDGFGDDVVGSPSFEVHMQTTSDNTDARPDFDQTVRTHNWEFTLNSDGDLTLFDVDDPDAQAETLFDQSTLRFGSNFLGGSADNNSNNVLLGGGTPTWGKVDTAQLADDAVTADKIEGFTITSAELATNSVTSFKIQDEAVTEEKLNSHNAPTNGQYLQYDSDNGMQWADVSVDPYAVVNSTGGLPTVAAADGIAIGEDAHIRVNTSTEAIAIGKSSEVTGANSIAIGPGSQVGTSGSADNNGIALGHDAEVFVASGIAIGRNAKVGNNTDTFTDPAFALGFGAEVNHGNSTALGNGAESTAANQITLGNGSITSIRTANASYSPSAATDLTTKGYVDGAYTAGNGLSLTSRAFTASLGSGLSFDSDGAIQADASTLGALTDVALSSPTEGQVLRYDATEAEWQNSSILGEHSFIVDDSLTLNASTHELGVQIRTDLAHSGLSISTTSGEEGLFVDFRDDDSGLARFSDGIGIDLAGNSGLQIGSGGLSVNFRNSSGLAVEASGFGVNLSSSVGGVAADSGLLLSSSGLALSAALGQLRDVSVAGAANGNVLAYNSVTGNWSAATIPLTSLSDVADDVTPANGQILYWSASNSEWRFKNEAGATAYLAIDSDGTVAGAFGDDSIALGQAAQAHGNNSIAVGLNSDAGGASSLSIGYESDVATTAHSSIAIGEYANIGTSSIDSIAIGTGDTATSSARIGDSSSFATAIGNNAAVGGGSNNSTAIGAGATVPGSTPNTIVLGNSSVTGVYMGSTSKQLAVQEGGTLSNPFLYQAGSSVAMPSGVSLSAHSAEWIRIGDHVTWRGFMRFTGGGSATISDTAVAYFNLSEANAAILIGSTPFDGAPIRPIGTWVLYDNNGDSYPDDDTATVTGTVLAISNDRLSLQVDNRQSVNNANASWNVTAGLNITCSFYIQD